MIVAFLDLLGFSALLRRNAETALDNMNSFNEVIRTRFVDAKTHPVTENEVGNQIENSLVTSFEEMISFSDSLILGGSNVDLFVSQLANFVASVYITCSKPFWKNFSDIRNVNTDRNCTAINGNLRLHKAFPVLFRGGISVGDDVSFFNQHHIAKSKLEYTSRNVFGTTYLNAVNLEKAGKGPRLFCDRSVVDALSNKKIVKKIDGNNDIFEIVWTMVGCNNPGYCCDKWNNVLKCINDIMLPPAINLYRYYRTDEGLKEHYKELLNLVCCGIIKYAEIECDGRADKAIALINEAIEGIETIDKSIIDGFLA